MGKVLASYNNGKYFKYGNRNKTPKVQRENANLEELALEAHALKCEVAVYGLVYEARELRRVVDVLDHRVHQAQHARRVPLYHHVHAELHHFILADFHTKFLLDPLEVLDHRRMLLEHPALKCGVCYMYVSAAVP